MAGPDPELFLDQTMTTILAGSEGRTYLIYKALLCDKLGYFRLAYSTPMQEATDDVFRFEDIPDPTFGLLVKWLYSGKIYLSDGEHNVEETRGGLNDWGDLPDADALWGKARM